MFISPKRLKKLGILGMNARNVDYIAEYNSRNKYPIVDNKLLTKKAALDLGMQVPDLYGVVEVQHQVELLGKTLADREGFVIKPAQGSGGKGILVVTRREGDTFYKSTGGALTLGDIQRHTSNIISGLYSLGGRNDVAMIEALIYFNPLLLEYSYEGVPDIRVIVFRGVPVLAMLRCSTHSSDGKANLHQGAVGVGIEITTGKCRYAVQNGLLVDHHPDTGKAFGDLQIPDWGQILHLAARCYEMTGLGYFGADIVLDKLKGPTILELNARPGLAIQIANRIGLRHRLERVESMDTESMNSDERVALCHRLFGLTDDASVDYSSPSLEAETTTPDLSA
ncbi:MAG: alpha-L-glutamate ligase-like protein [bacterium]